LLREAEGLLKGLKTVKGFQVFQLLEVWIKVLHFFL